MVMIAMNVSIEWTCYLAIHLNSDHMNHFPNVEMWIFQWDLPIVGNVEPQFFFVHSIVYASGPSPIEKNFYDTKY